MHDVDVYANYDDQS